MVSTVQHTERLSLPPAAAELANGSFRPLRLGHVTVFLVHPCPRLASLRVTALPFCCCARRTLFFGGNTRPPIRIAAAADGGGQSDGGSLLCPRRPGLRSPCRLELRVYRRVNEVQWQLPLLYPAREDRAYFELVSYLAPAGATEMAVYQRKWHTLAAAARNRRRQPPPATARRLEPRAAVAARELLCMLLGTS